MRTTPRIDEAAGVVRAMVADRTLKPGQQAPTVRELQEMTGVSRAYCARALRALEEDGTLTPPPRPGSPRAVAQPDGGETKDPGDGPGRR